MKDETKILEAILLAAGAPVKRARLRKQFPNLAEMLLELGGVLTDHGLQLWETETEVELVTRPELAETLRAFFQLETEELTPSLLEVLAIVAYGGPLNRTTIDRIRGVNSLYSLKRLLITGLISREESAETRITADQSADIHGSHPRPNQRDGRRAPQYRITPAFLQHLGLTAVETLPEFESLRRKIRNESQAAA